MTEAEAYEFFGLAPGADHDQVKKAYRRALRRAHPDAGGSAREFIAVKTAYSALQRSRGQSATAGTQTGHTPGPDRKRTTTSKRTSEREKISVSFTGAALPGELRQQFSFGQNYEPGFLAGFSRQRQAQAQAEAFTAAAIAHRVPRPLPAARLVNSVKISGAERIPHVLLSGYRAVLFFPLPVQDARYRYQDQVLTSERGTIALPELAQIRRTFEKTYPELNTLARAVPVTAALDSHRPSVSAPSGAGHELVSAANLSTAIADATLFLAEGPQPHVVDTELVARLADVE